MKVKIVVDETQLADASNTFGPEEVRKMLDIMKRSYEHPDSERESRPSPCLSLIVRKL